MKRGFALAIAIAFMLAGAGAASAQLAKGVELFDRGEFAAAAQVLSPLAKSGDPKAQSGLGVMYLNRMVEPPSETAAAELMISAGEAGFDKAQVELARMYREGHGVERDFAKSFIWSLKAAEAGDVGAQLQVADSFAFGHGVDRDPVEAYKWYEIAVLYWGSLAVNARDLVAESMSADQIAKAKQRAESWIKARAEKN
jgi:TPR repeat protein